MLGVRVRKARESAAQTGQGFHNLWRYLAFSKAYWPWLVVGSIAGLVRMVLPLYMPMLVKQVVDNVVMAVNETAATRLHTLWSLLPPFFIIIGFHAVGTLGRLYGSQIAAINAIRDIRFQLFDHLQRLSLIFHTKRPSGSIVTRVMNDVGTAQGAFDIVFIQFLQIALQVVVMTSFLLVRDWQWALVCFVTVPIFMVTTRLVSRPLRLASRQTLESIAQMSGYMQERLAMIREVQSFTAETHEKRHLRREVESLKRYTLRQQLLSAFLMAASEITRYLGAVIILVYGAYRVIYAHATVGDVTAFYLYQGMLLGPFEWLSNALTNLHTSAAAADRVLEFFDEDPVIRDAPAARRLQAARPPAVRFEGVTFCYPTENPVPILTDVSIDVAPGARVVLVGESGAGKSTLMNLLPRFYDAQQGRILIGQQDTREVTLRSLRRAIGIVPQEPVLFTGTIWENILYGRRDAPEAVVRAAAESANADQFIRELPEGYETVVGERGVGLSGGQIQRIAIARAFLKDPSILILDEATSNLDAVSESLVLEALDRLSQGRTTFIIAHRLSVARRATQIVVLAAGRVAEVGTHDELLAIGGIYHDLWQRQMTAVADGG